MAMARTRARIAPLLALLTVAALYAGRPAAAGEQPIVREIAVVGFEGDPAAIKGIIRTKEGQPFDPALLNEDVARLIRAGYFPTFRQQTLPDGVRIILTLAKTPRIRTVAVTGAGRSWNRKLRDELVSAPGAIVADATLKMPEDKRFRGDKERLRAWCQERGYRAVQITSELTSADDANEVDVTFHVALGPKHQVRWLRFEGNQALSARALRRRMRTKRDGLFTSRRYYDRFFEEDIQALQDYYRYKGFPNATVAYRRLFRGRRKNKVDVTITVTEGQQYAVGQIAFEGNEAIPAETLQPLLVLKTGETFSDENLLASRRAIVRRYHEQGHPDAAVTPKRALNAGGTAFDVTFDVDEGQPVTIRVVRTEGHPRTRQEVILRELELEPNMAYDVRKLERSQRALDRLQFFDKVTMKLVPTDPPSPAERDLLVSVEEGRTGAFRFGLGFSTSQSVIGSIDLTQHNFDWRDRPKSVRDLISGNAFVGAGQFFRIALMPGFVYSNYLIQYRNPYWRGRNESFGWRLYFRERDQGEWDERRVGLRLSYGIRKWKGDPDTDLVFHTRLESVDVRDVDDDDAPEDAVDEEGSHFLGGLGATLRRDRTDRRVLPTSGYHWELRSEAVVPEGLTLGGSYSRYWSLGDRPKGHERVFQLRSSVDYAITSFPIYERFYAGGANFRGFEYRGAGPHDKGEPEGGDYRLLLSAQYRYPLVANTLYGVAFVDTGTVTEDFSLFGDPRASIGVGLRLVIPRLSRVPISLDIAAPILDESDDESQAIFFSISLDR